MKITDEYKNRTRFSGRTEDLDRELKRMTTLARLIVKPGELLKVRVLYDYRPYPICLCYKYVCWMSGQSLRLIWKSSRNKNTKNRCIKYVWYNPVLTKLKIEFPNEDNETSE